MDEIEKQEPQEQGEPQKRDESQQPKKPPRSPLRDAYLMLHDLVYILAAVVLFFSFCVRLVGVDGTSMLPTLRHGDYLVVESNLIMGDLERGDIIVARKLSFRDGEPIVKRVIATEGQTVDIQYDEFGVGTVYVDGVALDEPYINESMEPKFTDGDGVSLPLTVAEGCLFVMGDNRNHSADSRYLAIGQIKRDQVIGKVLFIALPGYNDDGVTRDWGRIGAVS